MAHHPRDKRKMRVSVNAGLSAMIVNIPERQVEDYPSALDPSDTTLPRI